MGYNLKNKVLDFYANILLIFVPFFLISCNVFSVCPCFINSKANWTDIPY